MIISKLLNFIFLLLSLTSLSIQDSLISNFKNSLSWNSNKHFYKIGDKVDLLVNTATSTIKDKNLKPFGYYKLPFICPNSNNAKPVHLSLLEIINGDRFWQSDYKLIFNKDQPCLRICDRIIRKSNIEKTAEIIKNDYIANWVIDGLPGSTTFLTDNGIDPPKKYYIPGFSLGYLNENNEILINNHLMIVIRFHKESSDPELYSIVGFEVYPKSVSDYHCPGASKNFQNFKLDLNADSQLIPFTYSIYWREDLEVDYNNRWKMYNNNNNNNNNNLIHWVSLINSLVIILLISIIVAFILLSTFRSNLNSNDSKFNNIAQISFIKPKFLILLSILSGSGIQFIFTLLISGLSFFIFLKNSFLQNDQILSLILIVSIIGGFFAGFSSIQFFKLFNNSNLSYKFTLIISSLSGSVLILLSLIIIIITNSLIYDPDSPRSVKFSNLISLFLIYALIQLPISIIGGIISKKFNYLNNSLFNRLSPSINNIEKNNNLINKNLKTPIYLKLPLSLIIFGLCPCLIVFIESKFLYSTLLSNFQSYSTSNYLYGFIILTAILLLFIMIEIGIIISYLKLIKSNSIINWQWWIFLTCSFSIWIYLVPLSIYHLLFKMKLIDSASPVLYMVYSTILNTIISIACGSLALWSATIFLFTVIYSTKKKD